MNGYHRIESRRLSSHEISMYKKKFFTCEMVVGTKILGASYSQTTGEFGSPCVWLFTQAPLKADVKLNRYFIVVRQGELVNILWDFIALLDTQGGGHRMLYEIPRHCSLDTVEEREKVQSERT